MTKKLISHQYFVPSLHQFKGPSFMQFGAGRLQASTFLKLKSCTKKAVAWFGWPWLLTGDDEDRLHKDTFAFESVVLPAEAMDGMMRSWWASYGCHRKTSHFPFSSFFQATPTWGSMHWDEATTRIECVCLSQLSWKWKKLPRTSGQQPILLRLLVLEEGAQHTYSMTTRKATQFECLQEQKHQIDDKSVWNLCRWSLTLRWHKKQLQCVHCRKSAWSMDSKKPLLQSW